MFRVYGMKKLPEKEKSFQTGQLFDTGGKLRFLEGKFPHCLIDSCHAAIQ